MTKRHFEAIAQILQAARAIDPRTVQFVANDLADYFATENPRFDRARFLAACEVADAR